jgi:hypothetical protein
LFCRNQSEILLHYSTSQKISQPKKNVVRPDPLECLIDMPVTMEELDVLKHYQEFLASLKRKKKSMIFGSSQTDL